MAQPESSQSIKVGVVLARQPADLGEWLADGAAFETAGAHALWVDLGPEPELDPLVLTAALAAVTFRSLLVTTLPVVDGESRAYTRMLSTIERLSRGRLRILADGLPFAEGAHAGAAEPGAFRRLPGDSEVFEYASASAGAVQGTEAAEPERWFSVPCPDSRAGWRAALVGAAQRGATGLLLPADPRLLDMLRNPEDPGDRRDLQLAQG